MDSLDASVTAAEPGAFVRPEGDLCALPRAEGESPPTGDHAGDLTRESSEVGPILGVAGGDAEGEQPPVLPLLSEHNGPHPGLQVTQAAFLAAANAKAGLFRRGEGEILSLPSVQAECRRADIAGRDLAGCAQVDPGRFVSKNDHSSGVERAVLVSLVGAREPIAHLDVGERAELPAAIFKC